MKLKHQGSVKDIYEREDGLLVFAYSDRYSVFDWGNMPDEIPGKGLAIARAAWDFFQLVSAHRIPHACLGFCDEAGALQTDPSSRLLMKPVSILRPTLMDGKYDYSAYRDRPKKTLIPLEVVFRFGVPQGSSFGPRFKKDPVYFERTYGLNHLPEENGFLQKPIVEFFTKLEHTDRSLKWKEAGEITGTSIDELQDIADITLILAEKMKRHFQKMRLTLWDGKLEWAWDEKGKLLLVDSIGIDELRVTYKDLLISKEILRQYYKSTPWFSEMNARKEAAGANWKQDLPPPPALPLEIKEFVSNVYTTFADSCANVSENQWPKLKESQQWLRQKFAF